MPPEKLYPTKYRGYYVTETGKVFRDPNKNFDGKNCTQRVEVGVHFRGGAGKSIRQYPSVNISLKDSEGKTLRQKRVYVHRLIAETLVDNPHDLPEIDHIDRDKLNNSVDNLRWVSKSTNFQNRSLIRGYHGRFLT